MGPAADAILYQKTATPSTAVAGAGLSQDRLMALVPTPRELFRAGGKTTGPRFDVLKQGEVGIISANGVDTVVGRSGGASTKETPSGLRGTWYRLPQGTNYDDAIFYLHNDYADHWSWEPARDMLLADFVAALAALNPEFIPV